MFIDEITAPSFFDLEKLQSQMPNGYMIKYHDNAKSLRNTLAQSYTENREGFHPDGSQALLLYKGYKLVAWLTFTAIEERGKYVLHVMQIQASRISREMLPERWARLLLESLIAATSPAVSEVRVRPARLLFWWYKPHGVKAEDVPALRQRLMYYYDIIPRELKFEVFTNKEIDEYVARFPSQVEIWQLYTGIYHRRLL